MSYNGYNNDAPTPTTLYRIVVLMPWNKTIGLVESTETTYDASSHNSRHPKNLEHDPQQTCAQAGIPLRLTRTMQSAMKAFPGQ